MREKPVRIEFLSHFPKSDRTRVVVRVPLAYLGGLTHCKVPTENIERS